ncbi:hypothetical protein LXL04_014815 [Taraxacum kok-saghyz]
MESDLPLMELCEVDDSLIQPFPDPNQTPSKASFNYFTCSPLALPLSRTKSLKDSVHTEKPSSSSSETSNNKENINLNNIEMPKLGMGPIQMKRRKKGAECNLRKSLAWDRAFFTDEGILDPRELNMITGINAYTCGRGLPSISEEGNNSFSSGRRSRNEPNDMEASKEALLKELHDKTRTPKGNRVGIHISLPHHTVTHKVLSSDHSNRAVSKVGGCSEPSPASSYPFCDKNFTFDNSLTCLNSLTLKRPNSTTSRTAKKEPKLLKLPMSKTGSCSSSITKSSITSSQLRHNMIPKAPINVQKNVALKSSLRDVHASQSKAKSGPDSLCLPAQKAVRNLTHSSSKPTSSTKSHVVHIDKANNGLEMVSDRLQSCEIQDQHTQTTLNNSLPSGLRLPSPSLRFFDQSTSVSVPLKRQQLSNTHTGSNGQNGELGPPRTPCGITQLSPSSNYIGNSNTSRRVTDSNIYPDVVRKITLRADIESHEVIDQEKRILGHKGKMGIKKIAINGDEEVGANIHNEEEELQVYTATLVSTSGQSIKHKKHNILTTLDGSMKLMQDLAQTSKGQADTENSDAQTSKDCVSDVFVESQKDRIGKRDDFSVVLQHRKIGQENDGKSLLMEDDSTPCTERKGKISLTSTESLKDESLQVNLPITSINSKAQLHTDETCCISEGLFVNCIMPAESSSLEKGPHADVTEIHDYLTTQEMRPNIESARNFEAEFKIDKENQKHEEMGINMSDQSDVYECDPKPSNPIVLEQVEAQQVLQEGKNKDATVLLMERSNEQEDNSLVIHPPNDAFADTLADIEARVEDHAQTSRETYGEEVFQQAKKKDARVLAKRSNNIKRHDESLVIQAVPFSDEWLAAMEAAGEEILTMKRGAVQHSPPDKSIPEPSPWSPVKNKANQIGPYDCTKYTNSMPSNPHLLDQ